jgi:16S rRNA (cytosine967-C5)-methyltransferase
VQVARTGTLPFTATFDRVLVDAPCSGLGTLRRDPDIKWRRRPEDLQALAATQLELLHRAAALVRPGGRLVYATCSSEPEENEHVVRAFLAGSADYASHSLAGEVPDALSPLIDADGALRTTPGDHGLEAFFAAALVRVP